MATLTLGLLCFLIGLAASAPSLSKILGGDSTLIENIPYQLQLDQAFADLYVISCGAVIVGRNSILTAAHCVEGEILWHPIEDVRVRSGTNIIDKGVIHKVTNKTVHPDYVYDILLSQNDIAFCTVDPPFEFSNTTQPIEIAKESPKLGQNGTISGWGGTLDHITESRYLMSVTVPMVNQLDCIENYEQFDYNETSMFCAGDPRIHKDFCEEDIGGPFVVDGKLAGIAASRMVEVWCDEPFYPGIYVDVAKYEKWLTPLIEKAEKEFDETLSRKN